MSESTDLNASSAVQPAQQTPQQQDPYAALSLPENSVIPLARWNVLKQRATQAKVPVEMLQQWLAQEEIDLQEQTRAQAQAKQAQQEAWAQQTRALWGEHWQEEVSRAVRAADVFGGPQLRQLLEETGLGNHPAIVCTFAQVGKRIMEDSSVCGTSGASTDKTFTQALYGK